MVEVIPGVHLLNNRFVNLCLVVEADGLTLFDTGIARSGPKLILASIAALGKQPGDLKRILITHTDPDHTGGAAELKAATGATIYASQIEADAMVNGKTSRSPSGVVFALMRPLNFIMPTPAVKADVIVVDGQDLPFMGGLRVIATPGHTPGHLSYFAPAMGLLISGDSLNATKGYLRFAPAPVHWSYEEGLRSVARNAATGARVVVCGHGPPITNPAFPSP